MYKSFMFVIVHIYYSYLLPSLIMSAWNAPSNALAICICSSCRLVLGECCPASLETAMLDASEEAMLGDMEDIELTEAGVGE